MFFAAPGIYKACGLFTLGHLILALLTVCGIVLALKYTKKNNVKNIIRSCTIFVWVCEIVIIIFKISTGGIENVNNYVPLYFCSLLLYAGLLSSFAKGKVKRIGDVFLATGGIVGGMFYLIYPVTSIAIYPMFHLVSIHSFIFHGTMVYLGILINITNYVQINSKDIVYYFWLVLFVSFLASIVNRIFGSNLMFISQNFPGNIIIEPLYNYTGKFFTLIMTFGQATLPFYFIYGITKILKK